MTQALLVGLLSGALLGGLYLGALWFSVRRVCRGAPPASWLLGSAALRLTLLLAGFALLLGGGWERLAAGLAGFLLVRVPVVAWISAATGRRARAA
jgi:F1F0 ATPase subunit 2